MDEITVRILRDGALSQVTVYKNGRPLLLVGSAQIHNLPLTARVVIEAVNEFILAESR